MPAIPQNKSSVPKPSVPKSSTPKTASSVVKSRAMRPSAKPAHRGTTLFERLGGEEAVAAAVDGLYRRILADPKLAGFFEHIPIDRLKSQQKVFLGQAFGGPKRYRGKDMRSAHAGLAIAQRHFDGVAQHLIATLTELGVKKPLIDEVVSIAASLAGDIVTIDNGKQGQEQRMTTLRPEEAAAGAALPESLAAMRGAFDALGTNVFIADRDLRLVYMNNRARTVLNSMADQIEESFGIGVADLIGQPIDIFHGDRAKQIRRRLSDVDNLPIRSEIRLGNLILDLNVNPILDAQGEYVGLVVNWEEITEKKRLEGEAALAQSMVENAPINIMLAGLDLRIRYMNPASLATLKKIEHLLPCRADEVVGSNIDIFHKFPENPRRILSDPKNLPHSANIKVGEETLSLLVSPMFDPKRNYLGPMVTWEVITERIAAAAREKEMQEREREQQQELQDKVAQMLTVVEAAAQGDLTRPVPVRGEDAIGKMGEGLSSLLGSLRESMVRITQNAQQLSAAAEELSAISQQMSSNSEETASQANVVSAASEEVSTNVGIVASGSEEMLASIREISKSAAESARVAQNAVTVAQGTNATISKLGDSSQEIGKVIKVITSIAQQTNLLALNATIEAARAGEAGKGFAVVANEVKELAKETAKATEEISQKIEAIQGDTQGAVDAIANIGQIINQVNDISNTIASAVEEQTATTNEIGRNLAEASKGVEEIARNISGVAVAARSTTEGASDTQSAARALSQMAADLQGLVSRFQV
ncbi:MAG: methyl-accepting chemotaxis protein [Bryobacteraceae bacterium]